MINKLVKIQNKLKANKDKFNKFGNFSYRSLEDILEAVKPLLNEENLVLLINDEIVNIEDRFYVKATATISDGQASFSTSAFAREANVKKGMDEAQITGSCSSYARKYALGGLFLLDDNKDIDEKDNTISEETKKMPQKILKRELFEVLKNLGLDKDNMKDFLNFLKVNIEDEAQIKELLKMDLLDELEDFRKTLN